MYSVHADSKFLRRSRVNAQCTLHKSFFLAFKNPVLLYISEDKTAFYQALERCDQTFKLSINAQSFCARVFFYQITLKVRFYQIFNKVYQIMIQGYEVVKKSLP